MSDQSIRKNKSIPAFKSGPTIMVLSLFICLFISFQNTMAMTTPMLLNPGDMPDWDTGLTYLGTFSGNDHVADVETAAGTTGLSLIDKSDNPGQTNFLFNGSSADPQGTMSGTWEYIPGDAIVEYMSVKAGNQFALYKYDPTRSSGNYSTKNLSVGGGNIPALSHLSFFSGNGPGGTSPAPEPSTIALFGVGIVALSLRHRRRKQK